MPFQNCSMHYDVTMQNAFVHTSYWSYFVCQRHFRALKLYVQNCTNLRKDCLRKNSILGGVFGIELTWYLVYLLFSIKKVLKIHRMNFTHSNPFCALYRKLYADLKKKKFANAVGCPNMIYAHVFVMEVCSWYALWHCLRKHGLNNIMSHCSVLYDDHLAQNT